MNSIVLVIIREIGTKCNMEYLKHIHNSLNIAYDIKKKSGKRIDTLALLINYDVRNLYCKHNMIKMLHKLLNDFSLIFYLVVYNSENNRVL